jgi:hypothetical protein
MVSQLKTSKRPPNPQHSRFHNYLLKKKNVGKKIKIISIKNNNQLKEFSYLF